MEVRFAVVGTSVVAFVVAWVPGQARAPAAPRAPLIYVGGQPLPGQSMARIDAHAPGVREHTLRVMSASGPLNEGGRGMCGPAGYAFGEDADAIELFSGAYSVTVRAERRWPLPASAFPVVGEVTVENGVCYTPVMKCDGDATDGTTCRLSLRPKTCAPLRSPRRTFLPTEHPC